MKAEFSKGNDIIIMDANGWHQFTIPKQYVKDLISFIRSDAINEETQYVCTIDNCNLPDCVLDVGEAEDCTQAEEHNYDCKEECPFWKETIIYRVKG